MRKKVRKMMCKQNGTFIKEIENMKTNSGAEKYNNCNKNFTVGIQRQI